MAEKRCRDCKYWEDGECKRWRVVIDGTMVNAKDGRFPYLRPSMDFCCKYFEMRRDFEIVPSGEGIGGLHLVVHGHRYRIDARNYEELEKLCGYLAGYIERIEDG